MSPSPNDGNSHEPRESISFPDLSTSIPREQITKQMDETCPLADPEKRPLNAREIFRNNLEILLDLSESLHSQWSNIERDTESPLAPLKGMIGATSITQMIREDAEEVHQFLIKFGSERDKEVSALVLHNIAVSLNHSEESANKVRSILRSFVGVSYEERIDSEVDGAQKVITALKNYRDRGLVKGADDPLYITTKKLVSNIQQRRSSKRDWKDLKAEVAKLLHESSELEASMWRDKFKSLDTVQLVVDLIDEKMDLIAQKIEGLAEKIEFDCSTTPREDLMGKARYKAARFLNSMRLTEQELAQFGDLDPKLAEPLRDSFERTISELREAPFFIPGSIDELGKKLCFGMRASSAIMRKTLPLRARALLEGMQVQVKEQSKGMTESVTDFNTASSKVLPNDWTPQDYYPELNKMLKGLQGYRDKVVIPLRDSLAKK